MIDPKEKSKSSSRLHFVGIGGIGMSGLAEVFHTQGFKVSGSDLNRSENTEKLTRLGIRVREGHRPEHVKDASVVVISSAVQPNNPEVVEARRLRIPVIPRAEMLGELMRGTVGIAVAGSHGKTTTTSLLATMLTEAGLDPTLVIGGKVDQLGGNAKLGHSRYVVAEADESDGSFVQLPATFGIITNIDNDHMDHFGSIEAIDHAFRDFVGNLPFYGLAIACGDDPGVQRCLPNWNKPVVTYGVREGCDYQIRRMRNHAKGSRFELCKGDHNLGSFEVSVPGGHNVLNAAAACILALHLEVPVETVRTVLPKYRGVKRRFDICWEDRARGQVIVDDYAHHPTEIEATLSTAKLFWDGRLISVFQPHRYSRTLNCRDGFLSAFSRSDLVLVTDIFAAGEPPIEGVSSEALVSDMKKRARPDQEIQYVGDLEGALKAIRGQFREGDMVLCLGAGSITKLPKLLMEK